MLALYLVLTAVTASGAAAAAWMNLVRHPIPVEAARQVRVPQSWTVPLGALLGAGAIGLLIGLVVPALGVAAAIGLVLYFIGAIIAHLRVGDYHLSQPGAFLTLAALTLAATLAYRLG